MSPGSFLALGFLLTLFILPMSALEPDWVGGMAQAQVDGDDGDDDDDDSGDSDDDDSDDDDSGASDREDDGAGGDDSGGDRAGPGAGDRADDTSTGRSTDDDDDDRDETERSGSRSETGRDPSDGGTSRGSQDDDDSDDDRSSQGQQAAPAPTSNAVAVPARTPRIDTRRGSGDRQRRGEISGIDLRRADLLRLQEAGFVLIETRPLGVLSQGVAARLRPPARMQDRRALALASSLVPDAVFDLSHLYGTSQAGAKPASHYAPELVRFAPERSCGTGLRIGMVDGAVADHPLLQGARITRKSFADGNGSAAHGTAVASVMVGRDPAGRVLLGRASLFSAAVFAREGGETSADAIDVAAALDWLSGQRVGVVNLSIAGPENAMLAQMVARAADAGMIMVAAAGNGGAGGKPRYPAAYPEVIAVSAVDQRGRPYRSSTRGPHIDIAAPGVDIWAADARGGSGALWSGTSFAAPFVTVELAVARQSGAVRGAGSARSYLARNARDLGAAGPDSIFGAGLFQSAACR